MPKPLTLACPLAASALLATAALAAEPGDTIAEALSAAPPQIAADAEVRDMEGNVLREGEGSYTCFPSPGDFAGPMCLDQAFLGWLDAMMKGEEPQVETIGLSYMLAGDSAEGGASNTDPAARTPSADNDWVVEGPHVMVIVPDPAMLEGLPTTPVGDGPYVMWAGTPYAHIMMPVAERPEQRPAE
ncbi:MAG TPA: hypothetical protein VMM55_09380 [Thermohalobaculum sp.]|nr:hypothetical protein [Thermohalobaculum sp.]